MQTLAESINRLYTAFAKKHLPRTIDACPDCLDAEEIECLVSTPLRQLSPDDLSAYASKAFLTVGDVADYLYFLPRILEISATDDRWWPSPEVTGRAIRAANPTDWSSHQIEAMAGFNSAVIDAAIGCGEYDKLDPWMCAIARMGLDVTPHLRQIASCRAAVLAYFDDNAKCLTHGRLCNPFWELPNAGHDAIVEWFHTEEIRRVAFDEYGYQM